MSTFAERFCERYRVTAREYPRAMFWRCLHRRAILLAPFILFFKPQYFSADYDLIASVGRMTSVAHLDEEMADFRDHPWNHGFIRSRLRIRVSGARVCKMVRRVMLAAALVAVAACPDFLTQALLAVDSV